ncbi:MAG TPA: PQQ-binding-like beta-propeller repeat protein [Burkholderiales bacterium]|jgi:alcohol dehydrogenase (cytochrome c)|nr:PQQ-binding-like beta-propeller repeat protein [Burkholderiales bacterium]
MRIPKRRSHVWVTGAAAAAMSAVLFAAPVHAAQVDGNRLLNAEKEPGNWMTYHGTYKSWHYSPLNQINTGNVKNLKEAWSHVASRANRGLQGFPLAIDGVLYYSSPYNQLYALDGATGQVLWTYKQKLNEDLVARQTHGPYNRGIAAGYGNIYMGTLDGKLVAVDAKTGKLNWETKLVDSEKLTVGFTGAPLLVKDKVVIGAQGGEWPYRGPMFGVNAKTGEKVWEFFTVAGNEGTKSDARNTWGGESWRTGGGGGWMAGSYDPQTNTVWWGTGNPAPLYDWAGDKWMTEGPRPGTNLYTSSIIGLDPDSGELKMYFQVLPHDAWDFDPASGELMFIDKGGKTYVVHPSKNGFVYVFDRNMKVVNVYPGVDNINFVESINPRTGELVGRRDLAEGKHKDLCPAIAGGYSWNAGTYSPKTGLLYKVGFEWCMDLEVVRTEPILEPFAQLNIGANFTFNKTTPDGKPARGHIRARDPITGKIKFEIPYRVPPHAGLLTTAGDLLFVPEADGMLVAYDARSGRKLWSHNNGTGHNGGIISYMAKGKQYVAVMTGWGSLVGDGYGDLWGEPWVSMPKDAGVLKVFALP